MSELELNGAAASGGAALEDLLGDVAAAYAGLGRFAWDLTSGVVAVDDGMLSLFGYTSSEYDGSVDALRARVHPEDLPRLRHAFERIRRLDPEFELEFRVVREGDDDRWVLARGRLLRTADGTAVRAVGAAFDATARQQGEARTTHLLEAMPTAFLSLDLDWRVNFINAAGERLLQRPRADLIGRSVWELYPGSLGSQFEIQYRTARRTGRPVTFDAFAPAPFDVWLEVRVWPGPDGLAVYLHDVTADRDATAKAQREARRAALLAEVNSQLYDTFSTEQALNRFAQLLVPDFADWCVVTLVEHANRGNGSVRLTEAGCAHRDPDARALVERYVALRLEAGAMDAEMWRALGDGAVLRVDRGAAAVLRAGQPPGQARDLLEELAPESELIFALQGRGRITGLVSMFNGVDRGPIADDDLTLVRDVAGRAGLALDNARLYQQQSELAERFQRSLLTEPVQPDHLQITVRYVAASEAAKVGGDWYDAFLQPSGDVVLAIGDVVGHDSVAAAAMGQVRSLLRGIAVATGADPAEVLTAVDQAMRTLGSPTMATAVVARVEQSPSQLARAVRTVRWSNAGHLPPMVISPAGAVTDLAAPATDLLLGVRPDSPRTGTAVELPDGATVFFYTDGLVERRGQCASDGMTILRTALATSAERSLRDLCDDILARMLPSPVEDDVAILAIRLHPQDRRRPTAAGPEKVPAGAPAES